MQHGIRHFHRDGDSSDFVVLLFRGLTNDVYRDHVFPGNDAPVMSQLNSPNMPGMPADGPAIHPDLRHLGDGIKIQKIQLEVAPGDLRGEINVLAVQAMRVCFQSKV